MSKRGYISRYLLILKKLKTKPYVSYEGLRSYLEKQVEYLQLQDDKFEIGFSKRTLQRDIKDIRNLFGIDIQYSKSEKGYYLLQTEHENMNFQKRIESFHTFNALNLSQELAPYIHLEVRQPQGLENLYGLLHAIKNRFLVLFTYQKFWENHLSERHVCPLALKEFKHRWYILAKDHKDNKIKSFALDRLSNLEITNIKDKFPYDYNIKVAYENSFGVISPNGRAPQTIILSFYPFQGKYIKTLKLHKSQEILVDNDTETKIKLKLCITHDFIMELLSFGENLIVIEPKSLVDEIRVAHKMAFERYSN